MLELANRTFLCDECQLCKDYGRRMEYAVNTGTVMQYEHCCCDKVGGAFFISGYCEDVFKVKSTRNSSKKRKSGRRFRRMMNKQKNARQRKIAEYAHTSCFAFTAREYNQERGEYVDLGYMRHSSSSDRRRFLKKRSYKKVRKTSIGMRNSQYRKCFDFWWELD